MDVTDADLIVGTSAGATAAAQFTGAAPTGCWPASSRRATADGPRRRAPGRARPGRRRWTTWRGPAGSSPPPRIRPTCGAGWARRRSSWMRRPTAPGSAGGALPSRRGAQPALAGPRLLITAVDARTGEPVVFDRHSGVDLVDAVAASTSSGPPLRHRRRPVHRRRLPAQRERRPGSRVRAGAGALTAGGPDPAPLEWGCSWRRRSTSCGPAAAPSRRSCRMAPPSRPSEPT